MKNSVEQGDLFGVSSEIQRLLADAQALKNLTSGIAVVKHGRNSTFAVTVPGEWLRDKEVANRLAASIQKAVDDELAGVKKRCMEDMKKAVDMDSKSVNV